MSWNDRLQSVLADLPLAEAPCCAYRVDDQIAFAAVAQCLHGTTDTTVVVTADLAAAEATVQQLQDFLRVARVDATVQFLPELETVRNNLLPENESERCRAFHLTATPGTTFVCSVMALLAPAPDPRHFRGSRITLRRGAEDWPPQRLAAFLVDLDYDNEVQVRIPGEYSWRGGIVDVFSPACEYPVRLDYFGDELESIRFFDPETQRSVGDAGECEIIPRGEHVLVDGRGSDFSFLDYVPSETRQLILLDPAAIDAHMDAYADDSQRRCLADARAHGRRFRALIDRHAEPMPNTATAELPYYALLQFRGLMNDTGDETLRQQFVRQQLQRWTADGYEVVFCSDNGRRLERMRELAAAMTGVHVCDRTLARGLFAPRPRLVLLSDAEVFGAPVRPRRRPAKAAFHTDYLLHSGTELSVGDYAVHAVYGICRFLGLRQEKFHEQQQEVLTLEFQDELKVHVPLAQAYLVSRYVGAGKAIPRLSRLGSARWKRLKTEAGDAVADLAGELLRVQAIRDTSPGFAFDVDDESYDQFMDAFPYTETADQLQAITATEQDMAAARPMDRLICGDVGFGKTEVAMRAAFKAVAAGKQAAVLAPTTVLVQQHYLNFRDRFADFPVIIQPLSRFQTGAEQRQTLAALRQGRVDIVVGTHRLLSGDVQFKDLGLVVVDEEQRFGVKHKERLKQLRANVDMLTMTATPIPRTLYLSLAGARDMSTIVTPPEARLPVQTVVAQYDPELIAEAIRRELQRSGQVFYLHNRVRHIAKVMEKLQKLVPEASFDIGHGQMHEHELEATMLRFIEGRTDVLVCTTIIESGMDIPNANTIIIERADRLGLADLYQLRGRVGRYHRQAYAYFLLPKHAVLLDTARERLAAIRKYTQLGAGFKLAVRDMEIRGTGNLLGAEQSGHITAIGFNLYCQLLREAVNRLRKRTDQALPRVDVQLDFLVFGEPERDDVLSARLTPEYIAEEDLRVDGYRRLSTVATAAQLTAFREALRDRFGRLPVEAENLLAVTELRLLAQARGVHAISTRGERVYLHRQNGLVKDPSGRLPRLRATTAAERLIELADILRDRPDRATD